MTEEHKQKIIEGRKRAKADRLAGIVRPKKSRATKKGLKLDRNHPIIHITGEEKDAMDFFGPVKDCFRKLKRNMDIPPILREITHMDAWANPTAVIRVLEKYATIERDGDKGILISKRCLEGMDKAMENYEVEAKMLDKDEKA